MDFKEANLTMRRLFPLSITCLFMAVILITGCGTGPSDPGAAGDIFTDNSTPASTGARQCLGWYMLTIDIDEMNAEILPVRSAGLHLNLTGVLNSTMGVSAAMVPGESDPASGLFALDITLAHPFADMLNLSGFDVKGILITQGSMVKGPLVYVAPGETLLENADGYTRWWNPTEFTAPGILGYTNGVLATAQGNVLTATVNPYKLFCDVLEPTDSLSWVTGTGMDDPEGRAVFRAGESNTRRYEIRFPMAPGPKIVYGYAVDVSWEPPVPNPPGEVPDDFPIEANQPEAYRVAYAEEVSTLYYDSESGIGGGVLRLLVNAYDWQGQEVGDITSEVASVSGFIPGLMTASVHGTVIEETSDKTKYNLSFINDIHPTVAGTAHMLVQVESSTGNYQQLAAPAPDAAVTAFQVVPVEVFDPECSGDANNDWLEAELIQSGTPVVDQLCYPDDYRDFYYFEIPPGYEMPGGIRIYCDAELTKIGLYDDSYTLIGEQNVNLPLGYAYIDCEFEGLFPGTYYIRVYTQNEVQPAPYVLELTSDFQNVTPLSPIDVTPTNLFVDANAIFKHDNYVYMIGNAGVWVYDVTNPEDPVQISYTLMYTGGKPAFHYPYVYITRPVGIDEEVIDLIDFTDPADPELHQDILSYMHELDDICLNSTHLYVGTNENPNARVLIYDYASDPVNPLYIDEFNVPYTPQILGLMDAEGPSTKLIVGTWDDILAYDVEDPSSVTAAGTYNFAGGAPRDFAIDGDYIYVGYDETAGGEGWTYVLRQSGSNIFYTDSLDTPGAANKITFESPYIYLGDGYDGLTIVNAVNPAALQLESTVGLLSVPNDLVVEDDIAYIVIQDAGMQVYDVSLPSSPDQLMHLKTVNAVYGMELKSHYLILSEIGGGLYGAIKSVDISNLPELTVVDEYYPGGMNKPNGLDIDGDYSVTPTMNKNWLLLDVSDPTSIDQLGSKSESNYVYTVAIRGNAVYAYINEAGYPLRVYDVTSPPAIVHQTTIALPSGCTDIEFVDDIMYVVCGGVEIYTVGDPFAPSYIDTYMVAAGGYNDIEIQGNYMYLSGDEILEVADISTPTSPVYLGSTAVPYDWGFGYNFIEVEGQFAYMAGYSSPIYCCWAFPPDDPQPLGPVYGPYGYSTRCMEVISLGPVGDYLIEGNESNGLRVYDLY